MRLALAALLLAVAAAGVAQGEAANPRRILFVGNSLVTHAGIPERLEKLANAMGRRVAVRTVSQPDATLDEHLRDGSALAAIREGADFVIFQQGPSTQASSGEALARDARRLADAARQGGAAPALLMVWPAASRAVDFPDLVRNHRRAARESGAQLLPVGEAWLRALSQPRKPRLYGDARHPSSLGADLAAITIYLSIFPAGPQEFDEAFVERMARALDLPAEYRDPLVDAATRAIDEPLALQ